MVPLENLDTWSLMKVSAFPLNLIHNGGQFTGAEPSSSSSIIIIITIIKRDSWGNMGQDRA